MPAIGVGRRQSGTPSTSFSDPLYLLRIYRGGMGMADDSDRPMTIPELLEARAVIRARLEMGTGGAPIKAGNSGWNTGAKEKLLVELQEIEAELSERGYTDPESPGL